MAAKRTVLITGCSEGGIGHSLALEFARQRFHFSVTTRHFSSMMSPSTNPDITLLELNVTSQSSTQNAHGVVAKVTGGTLDIIYRNAGIDWELAEKTFEANLFTVVEMARVFMPLVLKAGLGSKIVFSNSVAAVAPIPTTALYCTSKAVLDMYAMVLDMELGPLGIYVVNVITGEVGTKMTEQTMEALPEGSPYKAIELIINKAWRTRSAVMPVGEYTQQAVKEVVQNTPPQRIWLGKNATLVWLIETLSFQWAYGIKFKREHGLNKLVPRMY